MEKVIKLLSKLEDRLENEAWYEPEGKAFDEIDKLSEEVSVLVYDLKFLLVEELAEISGEYGYDINKFTWKGINLDIKLLIIDLYNK